MPRPDPFIQLNRKFRALPEDALEGDSLDFDNRLHLGKTLGWDDLLGQHRVVILSEAGSGKTEEIRHIAQHLLKDGKAAFFLRIEHIKDDFENAFEVGNFQAFETWLGSSHEGWLLLDSIDEARLRHPNDFESAMRIAGRRLSSAMQRAHIILTGRISAWRPKTDLALCNRIFPKESVRAAPKSDTGNSININGAASPIPTEIRSDNKEDSGFAFYTLNNLTPDQACTFASEKGVCNIKAFQDAIERADAWSFTATPQDLEELTALWMSNNRIGSRLEIVRYSIERRLRERDQGRREARPISPKQLRQGASLIAAAVTLTKNPIIGVPDGNNNAHGIPVESILRDWNDTDRNILLSRPIFDAAIYGAVRFHGRETREYLTAEWFCELLKSHASRRNIESLFFRRQYDRDVVVPTTRPLLPWLAILDERMQRRLCDIASEVLMEGGAPCELQLETRKRILRNVCEQIADGVSDGSTTGYAAVQRFVNHDIGTEIKKLLNQYSDNEHIISFLMRMVLLGAIPETLPEAKRCAMSTTMRKHVRIAAIRALIEIGTEKDHDDVRNHFASESKTIDRELLAAFISSLNPSDSTSDWLFHCIENTNRIDKFTVDALPERLIAYIQSADIDLLPRIVSHFNRLLSKRPHVDPRYCAAGAKAQAMASQGAPRKNWSAV